MLRFQIRALIASLVMGLSGAVTAAEITPKNYNGLPVIILKVDDLKNYKLDKLVQEEGNWDRFINYLKSTRILKANVGAIGEHFDKGRAVDTTFYNDLKRDMLSTKLVDIFNHSYCYCPESFTDEASYNDQYNTLDSAQNAIKSALGVTPIAFGSGGNKKSSDTISVMNHHPDMKVWFFGVEQLDRIKLDKSKVLNLSRWPDIDIDNIDSPQAFLNNFETLKSRPYIVYQGHPGKWGQDQFDRFKTAMDRVLSKYPKVSSMTVSQYLAYSQGKQTPEPEPEPEPEPTTPSPEPTQPAVPNPPSNVKASTY